MWYNRRWRWSRGGSFENLALRYILPITPGNFSATRLRSWDIKSSYQNEIEAVSTIPVSRFVGRYNIDGANGTAVMV